MFFLSFIFLACAIESFLVVLIVSFVVLMWNSEIDTSRYEFEVDLFFLGAWLSPLFSSPPSPPPSFFSSFVFIDDGRDYGSDCVSIG